MYFPSREDFKDLAKKYNLIPVYKEILADMDTPVSAYKKMAPGPYSYLLESVEGSEKWARFSIIGLDPMTIIKSKGRQIEIISHGETKIDTTDDPLSNLKAILSNYQVALVEGLPRFFGGAVGYLSYDMVRFIEHLPDISPDDLNLPDSVFVICKSILIFDNLQHTIKILTNVYVTNEDTNKLYHQAIQQIETLIAKLRKMPIPLRQRSVERKPLQISSNMDRERFEEMVRIAKAYIRAGDVIQVVLSQRFQNQLNDMEAFDIYRALRRINPSPYMFYLNWNQFFILGSSPEILVRVEDGKIELRPIAGTRPRGKTKEDDEILEKELLRDPKERAEHIMLVDLGRNDVGRVARYGSVEVNELMVIERYSHVMHIVSNVQGILDEGCDCFDVLKASFPAGTVSGAPKIRAMEIIEELESTKRGPYAGAVGYFSFTSNMDFCITIRSIIIKDNTIYFQVGAGIVADSKPSMEYQETVNKAKAMAGAIQMAAEGLE